MDVKDTELTVPAGKGHIHTKTKQSWRLTDGKRHPVTIIKPNNKEPCELENTNRLTAH